MVRFKNRSRKLEYKVPSTDVHPEQQYLSIFTRVKYLPGEVYVGQVLVRYVDHEKYIVAEINPESSIPKYSEYNIAESAIYSTIWSKILQLHGDFGGAAVTNGFVVKYWNTQLRTVLIRVRHGPHKFVTSTLPLIDRVSDKRMSFNILYMGGTMRNCFKFLIKHHKKRAFADLAELRGSPEYDELFKKFTNVTNIEDINL